MTLQPPSSSSLLMFLCFHMMAPLLYTTSEAALSSSVLQTVNCSMSGNYTAASAYAANVKQFLAALPANVSKNGGFYNGTVGEAMDIVYGLAMCPADYSRADCGDCLTAAAVSDVDGLSNRCPGSKTVLAMFDRCLVRYSDVNFLGTPEIGAVQTSAGERVVTTLKGYSDDVTHSLKEVTEAAMSSPQRFAPSVGRPYVFVQCTWDLSADKCKQCLDVLSANVSNVNAIRREGQQKSYSCTVRYSNTSFMVVPFTAGSGSPMSPRSVDQTSISAPPSTTSGPQIATILGVVIAVVLLACALLASLWYVRQRFRRQRKLRNTEDTQQVDINSHATHDGRFTYQQLEQATYNFSDGEKLGAGAFGAVYKGRLNIEGEERRVAVKRITHMTARARVDFANEIKVMRRVNHRNIINLVGSCDESDKLLLVYELMEEGDLAEKLYPEDGTIDACVYDATEAGTPLHLDWVARRNILMGIASGLVYLHKGCKECILHRDIKPSNVMLDGKFNAKLCDFGLVTQFRHTKTSLLTNTVGGTFGYMDPEYRENGNLSEKTDVYSLGILLLEVVCGKKPTMHGNNLIEKVKARQERNAILEAADERLRGKFDSQIEQVLTLGLLCVDKEPRKRPSIMDVREYLRKMNVPSHNNNETVYSTCLSLPPTSSGEDETAHSTSSAALLRQIRT